MKHDQQGHIHLFSGNREKGPLGFTLLEILIALFIFSIISMILVGALRRVIDAQAGTEQHAARLRQLQFAFLILSRNLEQMVNRPVLNASGQEEPAFLGTPTRFVFTHGGFANVTNTSIHSTLERTAYVWTDSALWRLTWEAIDQAPASLPHWRKILTDVSFARFQYLDQEGHFVDHWPIEEDINQFLPRAVRVQFTFSKWGKISQLYVIPIQSRKNT